ncbi:hypothetical protein MMC18_000231, partial [Xylographa bjoerkii]|nr:hypothetical protein [Xylographa bjoerkii]
VQHNLAKDEMRLEITHLRQREILSTRILNALASNHQVPQILQRLANREGLESIVRGIESTTKTQRTKGLPVVANGLISQTEHDNPTLLSTTANQVLKPSGKGKQFYWNTPLQDGPLLRHLLSLYMTWIHSQYPLFSMPDFLKDHEIGGGARCSTFLVAAICAAASAFLNPHWDPVSGTATDVVSLRETLITQAEIQEGLADPKAETTACALAVMLIVNSQSVQCSDVCHTAAELQNFPIDSKGGLTPSVHKAYSIDKSATYTTFPTTPFPIRPNVFPNIERNFTSVPKKG